jgi:hypothetical protein
MGAGARLSLERVYELQLAAGTLRCCSGFGSSTARGTRFACAAAAMCGHQAVLHWAGSATARVPTVILKAGARPVIRHIAYRCAPRHSPHSAPVLATPSSA